MRTRAPRLLLVWLAMTAVAVGVGTAMQTNGEEEPLTETERATLFSKQPDPCLSESEYETEHGTEPTAIQRLATCTDITFAEPPDTAARWTAADFPTLTPGNESTSYVPPNANTTESVAIADAHASLFAIHPSTYVHLDGDDPSQYIAPEGTVRGFVDYRVRESAAITNATNASVSATDHDIEEVRLYIDGERVASHDGNATPVLEYRTDESGRVDLRLEADIRVDLESSTSRPNATTSVPPADEVTVAETRTVRVYTLDAESYETTYPNGETGLAIYHAQPWHGYTLTADGTDRVRGVWRYYTGRDTRWDTLTRSTATDAETVDAPAQPVYVHAFPSRIGPRAEPVRDGPTILDVWGTDAPTPAAGLHENVDVGVVNESYTRSYGMAIRTDSVDDSALTIHGVVRGVETNLSDVEREHRPLRESNLSVTVTDRNETAATLRIELTDARTDDPIVLRDGDRRAPIGGEPRTGTLRVNGNAVETNGRGVAVVTVNEPGIYTVEYDPDSWRAASPAYVGATESVRWHPLTTVSGWLHVIETVVVWAIPFAVTLYAGLRIGRFFRISDP